MKRLYKNIIHILVGLLVVTACFSCRSVEYVEVPVENVRTEYIYHTDSIIETDSVYTLIDRGFDTVYITKYKERTRTVIKTDTICKTDTISKVVKVKETVEVNRLKKWQKILMWLGGGFLIVTGSTIIFKIKKWKSLF